MKAALSILILFTSLSGHAQFSGMPSAYFDVLLRFNRTVDQNEEYQKLKAQIERDYEVECQDFSALYFPDFTKTVTMEGECEGKVSLRYKMRFKFKTYQDNPQDLKLKSYKIKLR